MKTPGELSPPGGRITSSLSLVKFGMRPVGPPVDSMIAPAMILPLTLAPIGTFWRLICSKEAPELRFMTGNTPSAPFK